MKKYILMLAFLFLSLYPTYNTHCAASFGGIGIDGVPTPDGEIRVRQLVAGGPAHRAGVRVGDIITQVDGRPTKGSNFKEIVDKRLRGRPGTSVRLTVQRSGQEKPINFTVTRRQLLAPGK